MIFLLFSFFTVSFCCTFFFICNIRCASWFLYDSPVEFLLSFMSFLLFSSSGKSHHRLTFGNKNTNWKKKLFMQKKNFAKKFRRIWTKCWPYNCLNSAEIMCNIKFAAFFVAYKKYVWVRNPLQLTHSY